MLYPNLEYALSQDEEMVTEGIDAAFCRRAKPPSLINHTSKSSSSILNHNS
jgi:hypothetical protein